MYEPVTDTDLCTIFSRTPFYNDTYTVIHMKPTWKPVFKFIPCIINDISLYDKFGVNDLETIINEILFIKTYTISPTFRVRFIGIRVKNGWWCCYFEKIHIWDEFASYGVCLVFSPDVDALQSFKDIYEKIIQTKQKRKSLKH